LGAGPMTAPLWSGRFAAEPHEDMASFTSSMSVDTRLFPYDVAATKAHAEALVRAGLIDASERDALASVLDQLVTDWKQGRIHPSPSDEDVHSLIERLLTESLGETGRRVHAGRSRNDLVATDLRLWCRDAAGVAAASVRAFVESICDLAQAHDETLMPGYTHLQRAQPVSLGFHLLAHGFALARDIGRFHRARAAADVSVLGAGALAGTTLDLDPYVAAAALDMSGPFENAMDAVSDRDFVAELVFACALCSVHLSRLAEEVVLWTSSEFGFAKLSDGWSTGSSMMPQKRNPDVAELARGRAATLIGDLASLLGLLKGLPLAYDRDLQEDKAIVFRVVDTTVSSVNAMKGLVTSLTFDPATMADAAAGGSAWATDLAEVLVERRVPFRDAHETVGALVARLEASGDALTAETATAAGLEARDASVADPYRSLAARDSPGGTAPRRVREQIERLRKAVL